MENIKVRVNNEAESKEIQELFFELGYAWLNTEKIYRDIGKNTYISSFKYSNRMELGMGDGAVDNKEITLPQLRDMVVLKRNDVNDSTHINFITNTPFLVQGSKEYFYLNNKWILSDSGNYLKPIEKKEMREFLVNHDDKWTFQLLDADTEENSYRVAVPSGAECLTKCDNYKAFWMNGAVKFIGSDKDWDFNYGLTVNDYLDVWGDNAEIVWERSEDLTRVTIDELKHRSNNNVNNPIHYNNGSIECIDAIEAMLTPEQFIGYLRGNVFKYQWRYQGKNGIEDLHKSEWYLKKLIEKEMKNEDE